MGLDDMADEVLEIIDDVMDNGSDLPQKVSNRLLLAAVRKNYRLSKRNSDAIDRNLKEVKEIINDQKSELTLHRWMFGVILVIIGVLHGLPLLGILP